jgi:hypothetical protein
MTYPNLLFIYCSYFGPSSNSFSPVGKTLAVRKEGLRVGPNEENSTKAL